MDELKNKLFGHLSNFWTLLVLGNILYLAVFWRFQRIPTWKDVLRAIPATILNFFTFYIAPTLSRVSAQWLYKFWNGEPPSWPTDWVQYRYNETKWLDYAGTYGTAVVLGLGLKLSFSVVEGTENLITNTTNGVFNLFRSKKVVEQTDDDNDDDSRIDLSPDSEPESLVPGAGASPPITVPSSAAASSSKQRLVH